MAANPFVHHHSYSRLLGLLTRRAGREGEGILSCFHTVGHILCAPLTLKRTILLSELATDLLSDGVNRPSMLFDVPPSAWFACFS